MKSLYAAVLFTLFFITVVHSQSLTLESEMDIADIPLVLYRSPYVTLNPDKTVIIDCEQIVDCDCDSISVDIKEALLLSLKYLNKYDDMEQKDKDIDFIQETFDKLN